MGQVSQNEDILERLQEDLENQRRHFEKGFANLRSDIAKRQTQPIDLERLLEAVRSLLNDVEGQAVRVFKEARKRLTDPGVKFVAHSDKKIKQLSEAREQLLKAREDLSLCRRSQDSLSKKHKQLERTYAELKSTHDVVVSKSKDANAWQDATRKVTRSKR